VKNTWPSGVLAAIGNCMCALRSKAAGFSRFSRIPTAIALHIRPHGVAHHDQEVIAAAFELLMTQVTYTARSRYQR